MRDLHRAAWRGENPTRERIKHRYIIRSAVKMETLYAVRREAVLCAVRGRLRCEK